MITRLQDYKDQPIPFAEVCIVGTGAAGLELATQLQKTFPSLILLEGGSEKFDCQLQKLCRFKQKGRFIRSPDYTQPFDMETARLQQSRLRQYGGTLNIWGGKWKLLDAVDFLPKPYLKASGWPFPYQELYSYYLSVASDYQVLDLLWLSANPSQIPSTLAHLEGFCPSLDILESSPANPKDHFFAQAKEASSLHLILEANVTHLCLSASGKQIDHLVVRSLDGYERQIKARLFILACGAIENARLLLCSNRQMKTGIGNASGWVGRNLLDHPKGFAGLLLPASPHQDFLEGQAFFDNKNNRLEVGLSLHPRLLQKEQLPNHSVNIFPRQSPKGEKLYEVKFYLEQLPNPHSRLTLSEECDELGLLLPCLDWKFREEDYLGFRRFVENMQGLLAYHGAGSLVLDEASYDLSFLRDASHQMGTTRMAASPADGVADANAKVFGMDNLYVMGSSLFPSGGNANPTLTILALARRLAAHVKALIK